MNSVNFTANPVSNPIIQQRSSLFKYKNRTASIVELNPKNENDLRAITKTIDRWLKHSAEFIQYISDNAKSGHRKPLAWRDHFYALTTQNKNYDNINPRNILGLMEFSEKITQNNEILYLVVNPSTSKTNYFRKYKQVGKKLVEYAQETFGEKGIELSPAPDAVKFYEKLGFKQPFPKISRMEWEAAK